MRIPRPLLLVSLVAACSGVTPAAAPVSQAPAQTASSLPASDGSSAAGLTTPEDAVREYLAGITDADVGKILQASAIDEVSAGFRFDLRVDRVQQIQLIGSLAPADYPFFVEVNRTAQAARVVGEGEVDATAG